jgi:hypothetical protein
LGCGPAAATLALTWAIPGRAGPWARAKSRHRLARRTGRSKIGCSPSKLYYGRTLRLFQVYLKAKFPSNRHDPPLNRADRLSHVTDSECTEPEALNCPSS